MSADILFIHPGNHRRNYQELSKEYTAIATPSWTLLLAERCRKNGYKVAFYDVNVQGWDGSVASELMQQHTPCLVVIMVYGHNPSASTQTMPAARMIVEDIKSFNKDALIAIGGTHPSALPERTLREEPVDFVIEGEGAYALDDLMAVIKGTASRNAARGIWFRTVGESDVMRGAPPEKVSSLDDELPRYAWDLLPPLSSYRAHNMHCFQDFSVSSTNDFSDVRTPYVAFNTSLGCPYSCSYCCINALFQKPGIRYWSIDRVIDWIDQLVAEYSVRNIRLDDELFLLSPERVEKFCDKLIERNYGLNLWVYGRVDTIREKLLRKMKHAGINWVCLGIESANEMVRNNVGKKILSDIREVVSLLKRHDIFLLGNYMFGLPQDTPETMQQTLDLAIELNTEFANFYSVMAYPGSALYLDAELKGQVPTSWDAFSQHGYLCTPLPTNYVAAKDVLSFRDAAFIRYHENQAYLNMMESRFGNKVVDHITRMLEIPIKRKLFETI